MRVHAWSVAAVGWGVLCVFLASTPMPPGALLALFLFLAVVTTWLIVPLPRGGYQSPAVLRVIADLVRKSSRPL